MPGHQISPLTWGRLVLTNFRRRKLLPSGADTMTITEMEIQRVVNDLFARVG